MNNAPLQFRKVERKQGKMRIGLSGPSGSGKTYGSLLLAKGMASGWDKVCIIDTENKSADLYEDLGKYNVITIEAPFSPERYMDAIDMAEKAGMEVIIIDSSTHEWDGKGGILEYVDSLGGKFQDWAKATPRHRNFIDRMLESSCHIFVTMRTKQDYAMETGKDNKTKVVKLGLKEVQREGFEYELTINFSVDISNHATASKDRTGLFMGKSPFKLTEAVGKQIKAWNDSGVELPPDYTLIKKRIMTEATRLQLPDPFKAKAEFFAAIKEATGLEMMDVNLQGIYDKLVATPTPTKAPEAPKTPGPAASPDLPVQPATAAETQAKIEAETAKADVPHETEAEKTARERKEKTEWRAQQLKPSVGHLMVFRNVLQQKEGIKPDDENGQLGWLMFTQEIEIEKLADISAPELGEVMQKLYKMKAKE